MENFTIKNNLSDMRDVELEKMIRDIASPDIEKQIDQFKEDEAKSNEDSEIRNLIKKMF